MELKYGSNARNAVPALLLIVLNGIEIEHKKEGGYIKNNF